MSRQVNNNSKLGQLAVFAGQKYLNLESYRKNGAAIATPVWFAEKDGVIYVISEADAAKVKRIRNNPKVRIAPCTYSGKLRGEWTSATARIVEGAEEQTGHRALDQKYLLKRLGNIYARWKGYGRTIIAIEL